MDDAVDPGIERVLSLLASRAAGQATNEDVETAINEILGQATSTSPSSRNDHSQSDESFDRTSSSSQMKEERQSSQVTSSEESNQKIQASKNLPQQTNSIEEDFGNYDDDDNDNNGVVQRDEISVPAGPSALSSLSVSTSPVKRRRGRPRLSDSKGFTGPSKADQLAAAASWRINYETIPLGHQGAKMMVAFGDGPNPLPAVVSQTLQATRLMLLAAIRDARHVRRRHQQKYQQAVRHVRGKRKAPIHSEQQSGNGTMASSSHHEQHDAHLYFRAMGSYDDLGKLPKCGFGMEELRLLYPEELRAYERWNNMRDAAKVNDKGEANNDKAGGDSNNDDAAEEALIDLEEAPDENDVEASKSEDAAEVPVAGGHLLDRLEQFDLRTDRMNQEKYMQFSNVRYQGSFLPRRVVGEDRNRTVARGRSADGSTANMTNVMVRFLHWAGFDVGGVIPAYSNSSRRLAPPNAETTQVLAFLAHDFFGRIVEKAIFWRNVRADETQVLLELNEKEQLQDRDITRALEDPEIRLTPLYSASRKQEAHHPKPQLYFGPGFEDRLEMEMEELAERITEEEILLRTEDDELFAQMALPHDTESLVDSNIFTDTADRAEVKKKSPASKESDDGSSSEDNSNQKLPAANGTSRGKRTNRLSRFRDGDDSKSIDGNESQLPDTKIRKGKSTAALTPPSSHNTKRTRRGRAN